MKNWANAEKLAAWLANESSKKVHRLDPIEGVSTQFGEVHLKVRPEAADVWHTWCNLIGADVNASMYSQGMVSVDGKMDGIPVHLLGLDPVRWFPRIPEQLARSER